MEDNITCEQDLQRLLGQFESIRLEFKASALLAQPTPRIAENLAKEVSSFANTEGGLLVIGIKDRTTGSRGVATEIDEGVDPGKVSPEWLEQLIASNVSPPIPGLSVRPIPLSSGGRGHVAFVVTVPKSSTAHQARPALLHYGRRELATEFERLASGPTQ